MTSAAKPQQLASPVVERVRDVIAPIIDDLGLDLYDVEHRGGVLRVTVDTAPGADGGITLDTLALASRLVSRELDHTDPIPGRYTLEVTSPGVERSLRTPAHFRREVGKLVNVRLHDVAGDERRVEGVLRSADDSGIVIVPAGGSGTAGGDSDTAGERVIRYDQIDRARTVLEWGPSPKPGSGKSHARKEMKPS